MRAKLWVGLFLLVYLPNSHATKVFKFVDANGVTTYTDKKVSGAQEFIFQDRMVEKLSQVVKLETVKHEAGETLKIKNDLHAPVQIELSFEEVENASGAPTKPIRWILPARSHIRLVTLAPINAQQPMRYKPILKYALGDPRQMAKTYRYPLPWVGGPFKIAQGANGHYSHFTPKSRYAIDIAMPEGTPIVAARGGTVIKTENSQNGRGNNPAGNFVRILHDDGTMGVYLHLQKGSVSVNEGQSVATGALIANSGNTGRSTGPHLHFVVQRNTGLSLVSIPFEFSHPLDAEPNMATAQRD